MSTTATKSETETLRTLPGDDLRQILERTVEGEYHAAEPLRDDLKQAFISSQ